MSVAKFEERFLSPPQVGRILRCGADQVLQFIRAGELKATNLSLSDRPRWKIAPSDLQAFLDRRSNQVVAPAPKRRRPIPTPVKEYV